MVSALNISQRTSGSWSRFILASDCVRPPVPMSWFLPHDGLHLATAHFRSQELPPSVISASSPLIPATSENVSVSATTASIILITVSWSWSACTQYHVNPGVTELIWTEVVRRNKIVISWRRFTAVYDAISSEKLKCRRGERGGGL